MFRKLLLSLLFVCSVFAENVNFNIINNENKTASVIYDSNSHLYAVSFDIISDVNILNIINFNPFYNITFDSNDIFEGPSITDIDNSTEKQFPQKQVCLTMIGGLNINYSRTFPLESDKLFDIILEEEGYVHLTQNTKRGGIIISEGKESNLPLTEKITQPYCWNYSCQQHGDVNGDGIISAYDVNFLVSAWKNGYNACADFNRDNIISAQDVQILMDSWLIGCQ